jgi:rare lipoprotein A (peptidoglycan hydrolase)
MAAANNGTVISLNQKAAEELDFRRYGFATVKLEMADKR